MAYTTPITAVTGVVATASDWNSGVRDNFAVMGPHLVARKTSDTSRSSTTATVDSTVAMPVAANEVWQFEFSLLAFSAGGTSIKVSFDGPTGCSFHVTTVFADSGGTITSTSWNDITGPEIELALSSTTRPDHFSIPGVFDNGGTAGNLSLKWGCVVAASVTLVTNTSLWAARLV